VKRSMVSRASYDRISAMSFSLTLVVPEKPDVERDEVAAAWEADVGPVIRLGKFWEPPAIDRRLVRLYGNDTFCLVLAQLLDLTLLSPPDDLLVGLDSRWLRRSVDVVALGDVGNESFPRFVKPLVPKQFRAAVYAAPATLMAETAGLESETQLLVSEPVEIGAEVRCFVLDGCVVTAAVYEGACELSDAVSFANRFVNEVPLPATAALDVGLVNGEFAVIEANATWGAGLNGCDPHTVIECLQVATVVTPVHPNPSGAPPP
jgi:hypothetical protein